MTPAVSDKVETELAELATLGLDELRLRWQKLFRKPTPPHLPKALLHRIIAYRIQAKAYGDLDRASVKFLDRVAADRVRRLARGERLKPRAVPPVPPVPRAGLKPGTLLVREHDGVLHRVMVLEDGFTWNGGTFRSLSEVARAITGTNWNGPRFFGLRDKAGPARGDAVPETLPVLPDRYGEAKP